jgi:hypothetical protein
VAYLGGGGRWCDRPPPLAWSMLEAVRGRPLSCNSWCGGWRLGVWLFEEVYGGKLKKCEKLLKKSRQNFLGREFWRLVCVLKKRSPNILAAPPLSKFLNTPLDAQCFMPFLANVAHRYAFLRKISEVAEWCSTIHKRH